MCHFKNIFFILACVFFISQSKAQTVTAEDYLKSRIARANTVSFEFLEQYFSRFEQFQYNCLPDSALNKNTQWSDILTFQNHIDYKPTGFVSFHFDDNSYGFDLVFEKSDVEGRLADLYYIKKSLNCGILQDKGECTSLSLSVEKEFAYSSYVEKDENYDDKAKRKEEWTFYFSGNDLYATRRTAFEVRKINLIGLSGGYASFSKSEICHLIPQTEL